MVCGFEILVYGELMLLIPMLASFKLRWKVTVVLVCEPEICGMSASRSNSVNPSGFPSASQLLMSLTSFAVTPTGNPAVPV